MKLYEKGYSRLLAAIILFFIALVLDCGLLTLLSLIATLYVLIVYRKSERLSPYFQKYSIVSPVDGDVVSIEEKKVDDTLCLVVSIRSSLLFNQSILYAPFDASKVSCSHMKGAQLQASSALSETLNERITLTLQYEEFTVTVVHTAFTSFVPSSCLGHKESLQQSEVYGFMGCGLTTMILPINARIDLQVGSTVYGSETLMGYLK